MTEPVPILIGHDDTDRLVLTVTGRMFPESADFWDGNWLNVTAQASLTLFTAQMSNGLRTTDLAQFRSELASLYEVVEGQASLTTLENWIGLTFRGDGLGHITVVVELRDVRDPLGVDELRCSLPIDRTYLPPLIDALDRICDVWPTQGRT